MAVEQIGRYTPSSYLNVTIEWVWPLQLKRQGTKGKFQWKGGHWSVSPLTQAMCLELLVWTRPCSSHQGAKMPKVPAPQE